MQGKRRREVTLPSTVLYWYLRVGERKLWRSGEWADKHYASISCRTASLTVGTACCCAPVHQRPACSTRGRGEDTREIIYAKQEQMGKMRAF